MSATGQRIVTPFDELTYRVIGCAMSMNGDNPLNPIL